MILYQKLRRKKGDILLILFFPEHKYLKVSVFLNQMLNCVLLVDILIFIFQNHNR